ncbi:MAG: ABC transporter permease [Sulfolobales archaeon]
MVRLTTLTSLIRGAYRVLVSTRESAVGLAMLLTLGILAICVPYMGLPYFNSMEFPRLTPPTPKNVFGTDHLGRDMLTRVLWGARVSLMIGLCAAGLASVIGIILGSISGYFRGRVGTVIDSLINVFQVIPAFFLALVFLVVFGSSMYLLVVVIAVTTWPMIARIMRAQVMSVKERLFVEAAKAVGCGDLRILFKHVVPHAIPPALAYSILEIGAAIIMEAGLSYLGLGDPNYPSWGRIIYEGQPYIISAPWISLVPGAFLVYTIVSINLIGNGLLKVIAPKLAQR